MSTVELHKQMTVEEFLALPEDGVDRELINGVVREKGMTIRNRHHSLTLMRLGRFLGNWVASLLNGNKSLRIAMRSVDGTKSTPSTSRRLQTRYSKNIAPPTGPLGQHSPQLASMCRGCCLARRSRTHQARISPVLLSMQQRSISRKP